MNGDRLLPGPSCIKEATGIISDGGWLNVVQPMFSLVGGSPGLSHTLVVVKDTACTAFLL